MISTQEKSLCDLFCKGWIYAFDLTMNSKNPHAHALGKLGGIKKTEAKKMASRENGKKGGRPSKFSIKHELPSS